MGVFARSDSPVWWLWLETTRTRERTDIRIGLTTTQRRDSRKLAEDRYHQRMNELAARLYRLPSAQPAIRFGKYAETYAVDVIAHRKGVRRELEILEVLRAFFDDDLLTTIDQDRVRAYYTFRTPRASHRTINREIDVLKGMLRDAVPKYLSTSPIAGMKRLRVTKPKRRLLQPEEERRLLKIGDAQDRAILILGLDTMIRLSDLLDLERADRSGVWLYVKDPKGGDPHEVALTKRAAAALDRLPDETRYFFTTLRQAVNPRDWAGSVRQRLEYLCRHTSPPIPYGQKRGITFHWATRRTGATRWLVKKKTPLPVVQAQGGWKTPDTLLEIYTEAERIDQLRSVGRFPIRSRSRRRRA